MSPPDQNSILLQCPACTAELRAPSSAAGQEWVCPRCGHLGDGWETVDGPTRLKPAPKTLPRERTFDPTPEIVKATPKEEWEPQARAPKSLPLVRPVARTTEMEPLTEPDPAERLARRAPSFERDVQAPASAARAHRARLGLGHRAVLWALILLNAALALAWARKSLHLTDAAAPAVAPAPPPPPAAALADPTAARPVPAEEFPAVQAAIRRYFAADSVEALLPLVRDPERVAPLIRAAHPDGRVTAHTVSGELSLPQFTYFSGNVAGAVEMDDYTMRTVVVCPVDGGWKVDWESSSAWGEVAWDNLAAAPAGRPLLMRVIMATDDYFNRDFTDARTWACFRIQPLDRAHSAWVYVKRGSDLHRDLLLTIDKIPLATIRMRKSPEARSADQFELVEVVEKGWFVK